MQKVVLKFFAIVGVLVLLVIGVISFVACDSVPSSNDEKAEEIPHTHTASNWIVDKEPTCSAAGTRHIESTTCHKTLEKDNIPQKEHIPSGWITNKVATCVYKGEKHIECTQCHTILNTASIETIPHEGVGVCSRCGCDFFTLLSCIPTSQGTYEASTQTYEYITIQRFESGDVYALAFKYTTKSPETVSIYFALYDYSDKVFSIDIQKLSTRYRWGFLDTSADYKMGGYVSASLFSATTSQLSYEYTNIPTSLRSYYAELGATTLKLMLFAISDTMKDWGVGFTMANFGFAFAS